VEIGQGATSMDMVFIEESKEDESIQQQFVGAQIAQMDVGEEDIVEARIQPSIEM
jgi:hypothetical protein